MKSVVLLVVHVVVSLVKLAGPGGARGLLAESLLLKHQLLILNRGRKRAPNLRFCDVAARHYPSDMKCPVNPSSEFH